MNVYVLYDSFNTKLLNFIFSEYLLNMADVISKKTQPSQQKGHVMLCKNKGSMTG